MRRGGARAVSAGELTQEVADVRRPRTEGFGAFGDAKDAHGEGHLHPAGWLVGSKGAHRAAPEAAIGERLLMAKIRHTSIYTQISDIRAEIHHSR